MYTLKGAPPWLGYGFSVPVSTVMIVAASGLQLALGLLFLLGVF